MDSRESGHVPYADVPPERKTSVDWHMTQIMDDLSSCNGKDGSFVPNDPWGVEAVIVSYKRAVDNNEEDTKGDMKLALGAIMGDPEAHPEIKSQASMAFSAINLLFDANAETLRFGEQRLMEGLSTEIFDYSSSEQLLESA